MLIPPRSTNYFLLLLLLLNFFLIKLNRIRILCLNLEFIHSFTNNEAL